ncbi:MAG: glycosyltransferase family 2 protein [Alphaproteobacteria bacterium]
MTKQPLISIITCCYRSMPYLPDAIDSILQQSFHDWELIVIYQTDGKHDDGGRAYLESLPFDKRIRVKFFDKPLGIVGAFNRGIALSRGKYICPNPADDISYPDRLKRCYDFLEQHPDYFMCCGSILLIDEAKQPLQEFIMPDGDSDSIKQDLVARQLISTLGAMWRNKPKTYLRSAVEYANDYDMLLNVMPHGKLKGLKNLTIKHRQHDGSSTIYAKEPMRLHHNLVRLSHLKRRAGKHDFLHDYATPITDWQILFNHINSPQERNMLYHDIKMAMQHTTDNKTRYIIIKNMGWYIFYKWIYHLLIKILRTIYRAMKKIVSIILK